MASETIETIETIADIVAEIRAYGAQPPPRLMWLEIADRLEAAWKRERAEVREIASTTILKERVPIGNAAALRGALLKAWTMLNVCDWPDGVNMDGVADIMREIEAALFAPAAEQKGEGDGSK